MTKKQGNSSENQARLKKGKIKRKQMFNELQTEHQKKIQKHNRIKKEDDDFICQQIPENNSDASDDQVLDNEFHNKDIKKEKTIDQISEAVNQLMAKNKIGAKNAFDVPIIDILDLKSHKYQNQNSWKSLSSTLQNDYKIYGYRIDAIHTITYSILNIMARRQTPAVTEQKIDGQGNKIKSQMPFNKENNFLDLKESFIENIDMDKNLLQNNPDNINLSSLQCNLASDPTLQRTKRRFDEPGLKGMLTNNISINKNLVLPLHNNVNTRYSIGQSQTSFKEISIIQNPLKIFESVQKIQNQIVQILTNQKVPPLTNRQLEQIWKNVGKRNFHDWSDNNKVWLDVEDPEYCQKMDMMIDQNSQNHQLFQNIGESKKSIGQFLKLKNHPPKRLMTQKEILQDSQRWLNQIDRKFLGLKSNGTGDIGKTIKGQVQNQPRYDDVPFDLQFQDIDQVLKKQAIPKQFKEEIEDRYLTTIRPYNEFKIQKILTLREQPQVELTPIEQQIYDHEHQLFLEKQIDMKRQNTSIREMKQSLYTGISQLKQTSFRTIYDRYCQRQGDISPALCFLTTLHLANQHNLQFVSTYGETDFTIKVPQ